MNKAFTLIELLVVVLIVGILAAVALPQYQKAVNRSRGTEALMALRSLSDAVNRYYIANGTYDGVTSDSVLDISAPSMKYWGYNQIGSDASVSEGWVSEFPGHPSDDGDNVFHVVIQNQEGVTLFSSLQEGKIVGTRCTTNSPRSKRCSDYFAGCQTTTVTPFGPEGPSFVTDVCNF